MTHARIFVFALAIIGLAIGGGAAFSAHPAPVAPIIDTQPTADLPATPPDNTDYCPASPASESLLARGTAPNSSCPPPKTCCGWKDPGHHICNKCC